MKKYNLTLDETIEEVIKGFIISKRKFKRGAVITVAENNEVNVYVFIVCGNETLAGVVTDCDVPECNFVMNDDRNVEFQN